MRGDKKRPRAGQWLRFWPNPEVRLGSASLDYNSQKARRRGRGSSSSGKVDARTRQHRKRELGLGSGWALRVCVSEFLRGAETRSQIGGRGQDTDAWGVAGLGKAGPGLGLTSRSDSENGIRRETAGTLLGACCLCQALCAHHLLWSLWAKIVATNPLYSPGSSCQALQESEMFL